MKSLHYYNDPGHAWLKVKISELVAMRLAQDISPYSYVNGQYAYLEEDSDAAIFINALKAQGIAYQLTEHHTNNRSAIRTYQNYTVQNIQNQNKVSYSGMRIVYGGAVYVLREPDKYKRGAWKVVSVATACQYVMSAAQLRRATVEEQ